MKIKTQQFQNLGYSKGSSKRDVHRHKDLPQDTRKILNKQSKLTSNRARKRTNKSQSQQKEEKSNDQNRNI